MKSCFGILLLIEILLLTLISPFLYADDYDRAQIEHRIRPIGAVHVQGEEAPKEVVAPKKEEAALPKGQATYQQYCIVCHKDGIAGAPKFQNASDWQPRLSKAGSVDGLVAVATKGLNAMPPKGTCQTCTDADLKAAIEYMLPHHD